MVDSFSTFASIFSSNPFKSPEEGRAFIRAFVDARKLPAFALDPNCHPKKDDMWERAMYDLHVKPKLKALLATVYGELACGLPLGIALDVALYAAKKAVKPSYVETNRKDGYHQKWLAITSPKLSPNQKQVMDWYGRQRAAILNANDKLIHAYHLLKESRRFGRQTAMNEMSETSVDNTNNRELDLQKKAKEAASRFIEEVCSAVRYHELIKTSGLATPRAIPWEVWGLDNIAAQNLIIEVAFEEQRTGKRIDKDFLLGLVFICFVCLFQYM